MSKTLRTIISIPALYLLNFIAKSIYLSFVTGETKIDEIIRAEWIISGVSACLIAIGSLALADDDSGGSEWGFALILIPTVIGLALPYSIGYAILYNICLISGICLTIWKNGN